MAEPNSIPTHKMTVDEFLAWAERQEGKFELYGGYVVPRNRDAETWAMVPERVQHVRAKARHLASLG